MARLQKLPSLLSRKIYKTGQTRGADDDQIFQNRVGRNSTVLIPLSVWINEKNIRSVVYENGMIVLIPPHDYFVTLKKNLLKIGLKLGVNALIFYEKRDDWIKFQPKKFVLKKAISRKSPLGGQFVSRIANTTSKIDERINIGYTNTELKGAGIRLYEYADKKTLNDTRLQLEAIFWHSYDFEKEIEKTGMILSDIIKRRDVILLSAKKAGLLDYKKLINGRILNSKKKLICPLCLEIISSAGMLSRLQQATGRERHDLTVTEINLFHIEELSYGKFNHRVYNLGWGHHHCNVVCKDAGIAKTLNWMRTIIKRNDVN